LNRENDQQHRKTKWVNGMVNDWTTFCRLTGSVPDKTEEDVVNHLLKSLEAQKQSRI
jgi:hypothetical protein